MGVHDVGLHDVGMHCVGVYGINVPGVGIHKTLNFFSGKKLIFEAYLRKKANFFPFYVAEYFLENINTTLLTHP